MEPRQVADALSLLLMGASLAYAISVAVRPEPAETSLASALQPWTGEVIARLRRATAFRQRPRRLALLWLLGYPLLCLWLMVSITIVQRHVNLLAVAKNLVSANGFNTGLLFTGIAITEVFAISGVALTRAGLTRLARGRGPRAVLAPACLVLGLAGLTLMSSATVLTMGTVGQLRHLRSVYLHTSIMNPNKTFMHPGKVEWTLTELGELFWRELETSCLEIASWFGLGRNPLAPDWPAVAALVMLPFGIWALGGTLSLSREYLALRRGP